MDTYDHRILSVLAAGPRHPAQIARDLRMGAEDVEERLSYLANEGHVSTLPSGAYALGNNGRDRRSRNPQDEEHAC